MSAKLFGALGAVLVAIAPMALSAQSHPMSSSTSPDRGQRGDPKPGAMNDGSMNRGSMDHGPMSGGSMQQGQMNHGKMGSGMGDRDNRGMHSDRPGGDMRRDGDTLSDRSYGNWDDKWGARPSGPPRHWSKQGDWYRHVRACQQRYRSYNPRTDMIVIRRGMTRRCML
ncbi:BA14K family protein [Sphingobium sp. AN558]|uniref:BA14K family protein n=1 Tax=Sphingobium sp. AN558 TaxID=3133442 RepID=UPI0030BC16C9